MRSFLASCISLLLLNSALAQTISPEFGKFLASEKSITVCEFDPEAEAVILLDEAEATHNDDNNLITKRRKRIKILKPKGISEADVEIFYTTKDDFEEVRSIRAIVCNTDANSKEEINTLASSAIYHSKASAYLSKAKFALPNVRVGSIIEYEYTITSKNYNGLDDWYFQSHLPTMLSKFDLVILPNLEFAYSVSKSPDLPVVVKADKSRGSVYFEMSNIAALRHEPFMDAPGDYIQKVEFQLAGYTSRFGGRTKFMTTWDELSREFLSNPYWGGQLNKNINGSEELLTAAKSLSDPYAQMLHVFREIQRTVFAKSKTIYAPDGVKDVWKNKLGTSAEVNLLLINLLKSLNLDVYPLLVSERQHGKVRDGYPFMEQFNNILALVEINNQRYILDAANGYIPPYLIPPAVANTKAFLIDRKKKGMIDLTETEKKDKHRIVLISTIDQEGKINGTANIKSYDYGKLIMKGNLNNVKEKGPADYYTSLFPGMEVDSFKLLNADKDSLPLEQKFNFHTKINTSGDYKMLDLSLFSGYYENPFISDIRFTDVNFGYRKSIELLHMFTLPEGWKPESLPKDSRLITPNSGISCSRSITFTNNNLNVLFRIDFNQYVFDSGEYATLKEFYKKMISLLKEQIILVH